MEAKELMIGDWIRNDFGELQQIVEIRNDGVMLAYNDIYPYDKIEPIPITPEILEKNGFEYSDLPFEQSWQQYGLSIYGTTGNYYINCGINVSMDVSNVYQLKHALRLCGIDKEIEL